MEHHPYRLRPYHNPDNVDESKVPAGWRFRYADEAGKRATTPCRLWIGNIQYFSLRKGWAGRIRSLTYIVPVDA